MATDGEGKDGQWKLSCFCHFLLLVTVHHHHTETLFGCVYVCPTAALYSSDGLPSCHYRRRKRKRLPRVYGRPCASLYSSSFLLFCHDCAFGYHDMHRKEGGGALWQDARNVHYRPHSTCPLSFSFYGANGAEVCGVSRGARFHRSGGAAGSVRGCGGFLFSNDNRGRAGKESHHESFVAHVGRGDSAGEAAERSRRRRRKGEKKYSLSLFSKG